MWSRPLRALLLGGVAPWGVTVALPTLAATTSATATSAVEEVVVTARRREERLVDVPVSANAISGAALQRQAITDMTQLGTLVPQVQIDRTPSGNGAIITIRGVGSASVDGAG